VKDPRPAEELLLWMHENYAPFLEATAGFLTPYVKKYQDHPAWKKDPKMTVFREIGLNLWPGWPGPASEAASEAQSKCIIVDMFAKAMQGTAPKETVAWAEAELKRIYEKA
jgi:multiple sugar transport system substrate-binding protein